MKYQLVLQWPVAEIKDWDAMLGVEDILIKNLSAEHEIDGHDAGSGEFNIFVLTDNPQKGFDEIKAVLGSHDFCIDARVAYRELSKDDFIVLWPSHLEDFRVA
jgi:hypothetical protein